MRWIYSFCLTLLIFSCADDRVKEDLRRFQSLTIKVDKEKYLKPSNLFEGEAGSKSCPPVARIVYFSRGESCTACYVKGLARFNEYVHFESEEGIEFIFIMSPRKEEIARTAALLSNCPLEHTVYLDTCNAFLEDNPEFPQNELFHSFMINDEGKVLMVGDPFKNEKMLSLFRNVISKEKERRKVRKIA